MMIQKIVIAGAGTMGSSMAQIYAEYFDAVVLYNHRQETLELAKERIESNVATLVETGNLTKEKADSLLGALSYTTSMECFKRQRGRPAASDWESAITAAVSRT